MTYGLVRKGRFLARPNRFIAQVELEGAPQVCHVKNTGRCRELLVPGAPVYLEESSNPRRKTRFDLIAVEKGSRLINMDSAAPNQIFAEWAAQGYFGPAPLVRREVTHGDSRFDFYIESLEQEVKKREKALKAREGAKKQIVLRLSSGLWDEIAAWAEEDFRSINGQIEYLLSDAVRRHKREK